MMLFGILVIMEIAWMPIIGKTRSKVGWAHLIRQQKITGPYNDATETQADVCWRARLSRIEKPEETFCCGSTAFLNVVRWLSAGWLFSIHEASFPFSPFSTSTLYLQNSASSCLRAWSAHSSVNYIANARLFRDNYNRSFRLANLDVDS